MSDPVRSGDSAPTLSTRVAYHRLFTLFFGAHRFYVGKWLTALVYPVLAFGIIPVAVFLWEENWFYFVGLYALLLALDASLIPRWVRRRNAWLAEDFRIHPNRYVIPTTDDIAPWARGHRKKHHWHIFRNYFFFWMVPFLTGMWAAQLHSLELLIIPIVVLAAIGLISTLDRMLAHHPTVQEIPGVGPAIERVADMRAHFWDEEPRILSAVWGLFRHWKKFRPYWTLALIVAATVVIEGMISFDENNRHLELLDAGLIIGVTALLAGIVALVNLVPITALSFHYSLSGRRTRLRFMTLGALIATLFGYNLTSLEEGQDDGAGKVPSFVSSWRLEKRMENPKFRDELRDKMDIFLWYYHDLDVDIEDVNPDFRDLLRGLVPNDEADAFQVIDDGAWALVVYHHNEAGCNLGDLGGEADAYAPEVPRYAPLAFVFKNTEEMKRARLKLLWEEAADKGIDPLDLDPLYVIDRVSNAGIFYQWDEILNNFIPNPECQSLLYDWDAGGAASDVGR